MSVSVKLLYESPNGDRWLVGSQAGEPPVFVRHEPNRSSGGQPADFGIMEFMAQQQGPQHEALLALITRLISDHLEADDQPGG